MVGYHLLPHPFPLSHPLFSAHPALWFPTMSSSKLSMFFSHFQTIWFWHTCDRQTHTNNMHFTDYELDSVSNSTHSPDVAISYWSLWFPENSQRLHKFNSASSSVSGWRICSCWLTWTHMCVMFQIWTGFLISQSCGRDGNLHIYSIYIIDRTQREFPHRNVSFENLKKSHLLPNVKDLEESDSK